SRARRPGVVLRVSHTRVDSSAASRYRAARVATPERWPRKFRAVRSAVSIAASGPSIVPMTAPGSREAPSWRRRSTTRRSSTWRQVSTTHAVPARRPGARLTRAPRAVAVGASSADVMSPRGTRSSARARATASETAAAGGSTNGVTGDTACRRGRGRAESIGARRPSVEAAAVLLQGGVDAERGGHDELAQRIGEGPVHLDDVVVRGGEHRLRQPLPGLGDPGDLLVGVVADREVPGPPVLGVDRAERAPAGLEGEADLPEHVLLDDLADGVAGTVGDLETGLHHLRRAGDDEEHLGRGIDDLERVGEELVEARDDPHDLLRHRLADLADATHLGPVLVVDRVLVVDLDELPALV